MMDKKYRILLIDDELSFHQLLVFGFPNFDITGVYTLGSGKQQLQNSQLDFDLILLDLNLDPSQAGFEGLELISTQTYAPVIVITNYEANEIIFKAGKKGAEMILFKKEYNPLCWMLKFEKVIKDFKNEESSKRKIFISHSTKDAMFINYLKRELLKEFNVWVNDISPGEKISNSIKEGIRSSDFLIIVLSPNSINSNWVQGELAYALELEKKGEIENVIPLLIQECEIPLQIESRLRLDFSDPNSFDIKIKDLIDFLKK